MPHDLQTILQLPETASDQTVLRQVSGSLLGLAIGDALGAHVEFRPREYLLKHPVGDLCSGGTWGLEKGQFTDDTSMALCLAISLIVCKKFNLYDQLVRYKWWYRHGYMSSTGECFDIGVATKNALRTFEQRQKQFSESYKIKPNKIDSLSDLGLVNQFDVYCSDEEAAGNGALMRLAPVPLFFFRDPPTAVEYAGQSGQITHGDVKAYDACRYYGALIVAALHGETKDQLLDERFYENHDDWFGGQDLHTDILEIAEGSYKKVDGYDDGIRGTGYIVRALEAALWAFWSTHSFKEGALAAVNLGDDTDTTAAIYGQLAGAHYGLDQLPEEWSRHIYAKEFILAISQWISVEGEQRLSKETDYPMKTPMQRNVPMINASDTQIQLELTSTCEDVCRWIHALVKCGEKRLDVFKRYDIDGYRILHFVDEDTLKSLLKMSHVSASSILYKALRSTRRKLQLHKQMPSKVFYEQFIHDEYSEISNQGNRYFDHNIDQFIGKLPSNIMIDYIEVLQNKDRYTHFLQQIKSAEYKQTLSNFQLKLERESNIDERLRVFDRCRNLTNTVQHSQKISLVRLWYSSSRSEVGTPIMKKDIILQKKYNGWFGNGIYLSSTAKDTNITTGLNECLIMCYAILLNPFPIIADDAHPDVQPEKFRFFNCEKNMNYRCHYVPVCSSHSNSSSDHHPPEAGVDKATFDQVVMFNQNDILPLVIFHLRPKIQSSPAVSFLMPTDASTA